MKKPDHVIIMGCRWAIVYHDEKAWQKNENLDNGNSGETWAHRHEIHVRVEVVDALGTRDIVLHEIMHAALATTGATYTTKHIKKRDMEEFMVNSLTPPLLAVLNDNPKLLAWLLEKS